MREKLYFFIYSDIGMSTSFDIIIIKAIQHNGINKASKNGLRSKTNTLLYDRSVLKNKPCKCNSPVNSSILKKQKIRQR